MNIYKCINCGNIYGLTITGITRIHEYTVVSSLFTETTYYVYCSKKCKKFTLAKLLKNNEK